MTLGLIIGREGTQLSIQQTPFVYNLATMLCLVSTLKPRACICVLSAATCFSSTLNIQSVSLPNTAKDEFHGKPPTILDVSLKNSCSDVESSLHLLPPTPRPRWAKGQSNGMLVHLLEAVAMVKDVISARSRSITTSDHTLWRNAQTIDYTARFISETPCSDSEHECKVGLCCSRVERERLDRGVAGRKFHQGVRIRSILEKR